MKAIAFPLLWCALSLSGIAQNLSVTFSGAGTATQIDSVTATNLRTNQWITLPGDGTLILGVSTGVSTISELAGPGIVFPNPFAGKTTYTMNSEIPQTVYLSIQNLAGQVVAQSKAFIQPGENEFTLSVNIAGYYTVGLTSDQGTTNYKVICIEAVSPESSIQYQGSVSNNHNNHNNLNTQSQGGLKSSQTTYILDYTSGDVIHYRCMSGIYTTIVTDSPAYNKNYEVE
ncbi:MAG: T9SS type A sorting domain-containing protein, partial [Bacteroidia bacterium]|nr:T9SS type A sorting domain-containing protein [Bacteroidia bacterium]